VKNHPYLDEVLVSRRQKWEADFRHGRIRQTFGEINSFIRTLRQRHYDLVIDFHGSFKSSVIVYLSRGERKLGYDSWQELSGLFLNEKIPEDMHKHAVDAIWIFPVIWEPGKTRRSLFCLPVKKRKKKCRPS